VNNFGISCGLTPDPESFTYNMEEKKNELYSTDETRGYNTTEKEY
jgi:hypothetical protein